MFLDLKLDHISKGLLQDSPGLVLVYLGIGQLIIYDSKKYGNSWSDPCELSYVFKCSLEPPFFSKFIIFECCYLEYMFELLNPTMVF